MTALMGVELAQELRRVRINAIRREAEDVLAFDLEAADSRPLALFTPGAHIDVHGPSGLVRQYSLCGDPQADHYTIAVKKEPQGRGGSAAMHERLEVGSVVAVAGPRNHFPLAEAAQRSVFVAGGIGITPILPMIRALQRSGDDWELHYCARARRFAAFYDAIRADDAARVHAYFGGDPNGARLDVPGLLREHVPGTHLYCCGPAKLMNAVAEATAHWPVGSVHFEWFSGATYDASQNQAFEVELKRSGAVLVVPPDRSILRVLWEHGLDVPSSCQEGVCGTCETAVCAGEPDHRDMLLSPDERAANKTMMVCVSRSKKGRIVLDL